jgi:hypothetical protein
MSNNKDYNIKLCYNNFLGDEKIEWKFAPISKTIYKRFGKKKLQAITEDTLYKAKFYNEEEESKIYYMRLYLFFSRRTGFKTLYIEGNISDWYYQKSLGRNLSFEEYEDCINSVLLQIRVPRLDINDIKESFNSKEYHDTLACITKHKEFKEKKRFMRTYNEKPDYMY